MKSDEIKLARLVFLSDSLYETLQDLLFDGMTMDKLLGTLLDEYTNRLMALESRAKRQDKLNAKRHSMKGCHCEYCNSRRVGGKHYYYGRKS